MAGFQTNRKGKAILGVVEAFCRADGEQGQKTQYSQNFARLQRLLFHNNTITQNCTRNSYIAYINEVVPTKHDNFEGEATQICTNGESRERNVNNIYVNCVPHENIVMRFMAR